MVMHQPHASHDVFMAKALELAQQAFALGEVPIGAVVVLNQTIIGQGFNQTETTHDPTAHAEMIAIREASRHLGNARLSEATLYVTIEPCAMCAGASVWARVKNVVFGAREPKGGSLVSCLHYFDTPHINHRPHVIEGVLQDACAQLMKTFFKNKRV
jgi:tRNA(adenine34) deaminase